MAKRAKTWLFSPFLLLCDSVVFPIRTSLNKGFCGSDSAQKTVAKIFAGVVICLRSSGNQANNHHTKGPSLAIVPLT
jgi:hypothetical protein